MDTYIIHQSFAVDANNRVVSIDDVPRGLKCNCSCPHCGDRLIARKGDIREWHFAHQSEENCIGGAESALHMAAKQILIDSGGMMLPEASVSVTETLSDGRKGSGEAHRPEVWLDFQNIEAEKTYGDIRPDIAVNETSNLLFIEIAVTHFVDEQKIDVLREIKVPTVEIDLASIERTKWSWDTLREAVVDTTQYKYWIEILDKDALEEEARDAALKAAGLCLLPDSSTHTYSKPRRLRFLISGKIVDVIERPFGMAIWSPYDPSLNITIKSLMRLLGGRWQPRFKNWLAPLESKQYILEELEKLSGFPPEILNR